MSANFVYTDIYILYIEYMSECKCVAQQASYLTTAENFFGEIFLSDFNWKVSHPDKVDAEML